MRHRIGAVPPAADRHLSESAEDNSGVGVNYADAYLGAFRTTLDDGRKVLGKRRGLKITLRAGERQGEGLLRRLEHGPDVRNIVERAVEEAAADAGFSLSVEDGTIYLLEN